jgi:hypothetical protein
MSAPIGGFSRYWRRSNQSWPGSSARTWLMRRLSSVSPSAKSWICAHLLTGTRRRTAARRGPPPTSSGGRAAPAPRWPPQPILALAHFSRSSRSLPKGKQRCTAAEPKSDAFDLSPERRTVLLPAGALHRSAARWSRPGVGVYAPLAWCSAGTPQLGNFLAISSRWHRLLMHSRWSFRGHGRRDNPGTHQASLRHRVADQLRRSTASGCSC